MKPILFGLLLTIPAACASPATPEPEPEPDHLYWFSASEDDAPRPWAVILPGGGGIDNFGDGGEYYFDFARWLNSHGIDALVVHYQEDAAPLEEVGLPAYGAEIAGAVLRGVEHERSLGRMDMRCDGLVFAWSMGGQGMWELSGSGDFALQGLSEAIAYYPAVHERGAGYDPKVPVTLLQGEADRLTPLPMLREFIAGSTGPDAFSVHLFADAHHGFDLYTVPDPQLDGGFVYDAESAQAAKSLLEQKMEGADLGCGLD